MSSEQGWVGWGRINSLHTLISVIIIRRQRKIICSFFTWEVEGEAGSVGEEGRVRF